MPEQDIWSLACLPGADAPSTLEWHGVRRQQRRQLCALGEPLSNAPQLPYLPAAPAEHLAGRGQRQRVVRACHTHVSRTSGRRVNGNASLTPCSVQFLTKRYNVSRRLLTVSVMTSAVGCSPVSVESWLLTCQRRHASAGRMACGLRVASLLKRASAFNGCMRAVPDAHGSTAGQERVAQS
jgi:hypothetical protein